MPTPIEELLKRRMASMNNSLSEEEKKKLKSSYFARLMQSDPEKFKSIFNYDSKHYGEDSPLTRFNNFRNAMKNSQTKINPLPINFNAPIITNLFSYFKAVIVLTA